MMSRRACFFILAAAGLWFFFAGNQILPLTNPDEVFYAQTAREMIQKESWSVPILFGQPQFEKPILTYLLIKIAFLIGGVNNFMARLAPALFALWGVWLVFDWVWFEFRDSRRALVPAWILSSSALYIGLARTVFTDMILCVFIQAALVSFYKAYQSSSERRRGILGFFIFSALAVLTKGLPGVVIPFGVAGIFLVVQGQMGFFRRRETVGGFVLFCLIAFPWYVFMIKRYGDLFIQEFFVNDHWRRILEAEHRSNDTWYFYPLTMLAGMFPWTLFSAAGLWEAGRRLRQKAPHRSWVLFALIWIGVTLAVFQPAHSKLASYAFPLFPALAVLTGEFVVRAFDARERGLTFWVRWQAGILFLFPLGVWVAARQYPQYAPSASLMVAMTVVYALLAAVLWISESRRWLGGIMATLSLAVPTFLAMAFVSSPIFADYVSTRSAGKFLVSQRELEDAPVLCSKFFARGVRYFTDADVAVMDLAGPGFFSPHPIPTLRNDDDLRLFLRRFDRIYVVLKKSDWESLQRVVGSQEGKVCRLLKVFGDEFVGEVVKEAENKKKA